jgi:hypothetical protein
MPKIHCYILLNVKDFGAIADGTTLDSKEYKVFNLRTLRILHNCIPLHDTHVKITEQKLRSTA